MSGISDLLDQLDAVPYGTFGLVLPDWPEDDPRWPLVDAELIRQRRLAALDGYREVVEAAFWEQVRATIAEGATRPQVAKELGISLRDLKAKLGES